MKDRRARRWAIAGFAVANAAVASYFLVLPRWPDLRDAAHPNVAAAALGVLAAAAAWGRARRAGARRGTEAFLALESACVAAFLATYVYYLSYQLPQGAGAPAVGARAPGFRLPDQEGRARSLDELRGRWVVVDFFRGHW
ncbi:MAG: redoxin domain-containing protein [Planctomycetes bacterium]|nr:redoxin domain-containing protein [Planctomycetota bacterium]